MLKFALVCQGSHASHPILPVIRLLLEPPQVPRKPRVAFGVELSQGGEARAVARAADAVVAHEPREADALAAHEDGVIRRR